MIYARIIICLSILLNSNYVTAQLHSKTVVRKNHTGNFWVEEFGIKRHPEKDLIGGRPAQFYLNNPKVQSIAKNFYQGKFRPTDNDSTTYLLSLVTTPNSTIRPFYRWCLDQTINIADGALGEYLGEPALKYAIKYPQEFFEYMDKDKTRQRYRQWVEIIAYSGLPDYTVSAADNKRYLIKKLSADCRHCSITYQKKIKRFAGDVVKYQNEID